MNRKKIFAAGITVGIICIIIAIYYVIPGYSHLFVLSQSTTSHKTHFIVFTLVGLLAFAVAYANRPKPTTNTPEQAQVEK